MPIIENSVCQEMFHTAGHNKKILPSFLCAGYANGQKDSCEVRVAYIFLSIYSHVDISIRCCILRLIGHTRDYVFIYNIYNIRMV